jgi:hypothetical protein
MEKYITSSSIAPEVCTVVGSTTLVLHSGIENSESWILAFVTFLQ